jgi:hypothetical protein
MTQVTEVANRCGKEITRGTASTDPSARLRRACLFEEASRSFRNQLIPDALGELGWVWTIRPRPDMGNTTTLVPRFTRE